VRRLLAEEQGLTLAEVLAALTVLSIGLLALISLLPLAGSGVHEGAHRSGAVFLASQRLEQVKAAVGLAEGDVDPLSGVATLFPDEPILAAPHGAFSRSVRIRDCGLAPGCSGVNTSGVRQVSVVVTYPSAAGQEAHPVRRGMVLLSTYIGPR
jgi:prepilin-type N-terminal cleavage/methylation domain-containing protein